MDYLAELNPKQKEAVLTIEGPLLVVAGAGSGKTRVLTHRIAHLLKEGVAPDEILAVTFTNKAAGEMRERVESLVRGEAPTWISTFHSACVRILRIHGARGGLPDNFVIYDAQDQLAAMQKVIKELNYDPKKFAPRVLLSKVSKLKNELVSPEDFQAQGTGDPEEEALAKIYPRYQQFLRQNRALDFDDLLFETVRILKADPELAGFYQRRFQYLLIDEYQDTNYAQYELAKILAKGHRNICAVGDADQSIYGWRGADIRNILRFQEDYPEAQVIKLEQNYRSTKTILAAANEVIANNLLRQKKELWTSNSEGDPIFVYEGDNERGEARFIAEQILAAQRSFGDLAVLYRTNAQSRALEQELSWRNIPYRLVGSVGFYDRKEIKDVLAYLRLLYNPQDSVAMERIINVPKRGIGATSWQRLMDFAGNHNLSPWQGLCVLAEDPQRAVTAGITPRIQKPLFAFHALIASLLETAGELAIDDLLRLVLEETEYLEELQREESETAQMRIQNVEELFTVAKQFKEESADWSLGAFLEDVALVTDLDSLSPEEEAVTLMTLHSAKGLEYPVVFLAGMEEGLFPLSRSLWDDGQLEEERRLCYVGITRARERLYLTYTKQRTLYGQTNRATPSRFLEELPKELLASPGEECRQESYKKNFPSSVSTPKGQGEYKVGERILHSSFGQGTVVSVAGQGEKSELTVAFPQGGIKKLLVAYAPIQKLS